MVAGIDDSITRLTPASDLEYQEIERAMEKAYGEWNAHLIAGLRELEIAMMKHEYQILAGTASGELLSGARQLLQSEVIASARLKSIPAIIKKMRKHGEPLINMLDIWGYRIIVNDAANLEKVLSAVTGLWPAPGSEEMTHRHGALKFPSPRDFRLRDFPGLSDATSRRYDEVIHVNRQPPFGVVEIQILSADLYRRVEAGTGEEAYVNYQERRDSIRSQAAEMTNAVTIDPPSFRRADVAITRRHHRKIHGPWWQGQPAD